MADRLRELARESAIDFHNYYLSYGFHHPNAGDPSGPAHLGVALALPDNGFSTCPHPDCVLVRESLARTAHPVASPTHKQDIFCEEDGSLPCYAHWPDVIDSWCEGCKNQALNAFHTSMQVGASPVSEAHSTPPQCVIGEYCRKHGFIHGAEAEELRARFEKLLDDTKFDEEGRPLRRMIQHVLDDVDARDSAALTSGPDGVIERAPVSEAHSTPSWILLNEAEQQLVGQLLEARGDVEAGFVTRVRKQLARGAEPQANEKR